MAIKTCFLPQAAPDHEAARIHNSIILMQLFDKLEKDFFLFHSRIDEMKNNHFVLGDCFVGSFAFCCMLCKDITLYKQTFTHRFLSLLINFIFLADTLRIRE